MPPRPGWHDGIAGVSAVTAATVDARVILELANLGQIGELLERARNSGAQLLEFAVHSPNLSDAFIALTGHALRDKAAEIWRG